MKIKRSISLVIAMLLSVCVLLIPGTVVQAEAGATLSTDNMSISWDEKGVINSVVLQGKEMIADSPSGFMITDAANGNQYGFQVPLSGGQEKKQSADVANAGLKMEVTYRQKGHAIYVEGTVTDTSKTDRLIRLDYMLPVSAQGMYWYDDISTRKQVKLNGNYSNYISFYNHKISTYPYGTVSNGEQAVALGVPMDPPQCYVIRYKNVDGLQAMTLQFDFALSAKAKKTASKADFSFVIYAPTEPEWGFRSASQDYYDLFPQYFEIKSQGGGNWLFQHEYKEVVGAEDFYFGYNETPGSYKFDEDSGVTSLVYTAPAEQWMAWPGMPKEPEPTYEQYMGRFEELLNDNSGSMDRGFPTVTQKNVAAAMKNSAILLDNGKYHTMGWYVYDVTVGFVTNHNPDIPGWNSFKLQISSVEKAEKAAREEGSKLGGVYIDNLSGLGGANYREEHYQYVDTPLLWDNNKRVMIPGYSSTYSYTKGIRERCDANDQIIFANMVFPENGVVQYVHMVDVPGSEIAPSWGWSPDLHRLRRTMAYQKPWTLLLIRDAGGTNDWGVNPPSDAQREDVMRSAIAYGLFANVIGYRVSMTEYDKARPVFRKYAYTAVMQDKLGWNPITYAKAGGIGRVDCERFGDLGTGAAIFTAYNVDGNGGNFSGDIAIDLAAMNVSEERAAELIGFDPINNKIIPLDKATNELSYRVTLGKKGLSVVMVGTKAEIWALLYERIKTAVTRSDDATVEIPDVLYGLYDVVPSQWEDIMSHMAVIRPFKDMDAATAMKKVGTLAAEMQATVPLVEAAIDEMYNCTDLLEIDVMNVFNDSYATMSGLFDLSSMGVGGTDAEVGDATDANNSTLIIIICSGMAVLLAVAGALVALLLLKKKKS